MKEILKQILVVVLHKLSHLVIKKYKPKIIGITGTVGKTTTKDAVYTALSRFESVRKSQKSFNSELGIPLTILDSDNPGRDMLGWLRVIVDGLVMLFFKSPYPKWLVLEVGTDKPGDIAMITKWLKTDITIVTKLSKVPVHVEAFGAPEYLFEEKGNLVKALKPGGTLILNADDLDVMAYKSLCEEKILLFGEKLGSDIRSSDYQILYDEQKLPHGIEFNVLIGDTESHRITLADTLGEQNISHVLVALLVVKDLGLDVRLAASSFKSEHPTPGRMRLLDGLKGSLLIDDSYNSSPVALEEALKTLKSIKIGRGHRKIAILGDMLELGRYTVDEHKKMGERASKSATILVTVGIRSRYAAEAALSGGMSESKVFQFDDSLEAGMFMKDLIKSGDVILIKGSQGTRMEKCVEELMAKPEYKEKLLVRQSTDWADK
ncbi:MAG TPA: UDP-N-acetylmuramoyl-tripeptide--D-alanyl-D-alanine ligase [Parcubacteria group bacterium]|nr:UDP-N-acetylmuramoyl-tripeptide--D-alanyl-D-alanine ligase [Parcubacteria group bacterium]